MALPGRHFCSGLVVAAGLLVGAAPVAASETRITVQATVIAVQCTPQQRLRIRACAPVMEKLTVEEARTLADAHVFAAQTERMMPVGGGAPDPSRQVLVRTLYY